MIQTVREIRRPPHKDIKLEGVKRACGSNVPVIEI
jgi:hypothetical protein